MTYALIAFALAVLADIVTTIRGLKKGGTELNPILAWAMRKLGKGWLVFKVVLSLIAAFVLYKGDAEWAIWVLAALTNLVAVSNVIATRDTP